MIRLKELVPASIQESINDKNVFKAIFMAGGPGSGKSFIGMEMFGNDFFGAKVVSSDEIFEHFLRKENLPFVIEPGSPDYEKQMQQRDKAKELTKTKMYTYIDGMLPLLIDGTGKDYKKIARSASTLKEIGYDTEMVFVNTSLDIAMGRNRKRERKVADSIVKKMWDDVQSNIGKFQSLFGNEQFHIIDNNKVYDKDSEELRALSTKLYKMGQRILNKPLQNSRGKKILQHMKDVGAKYLSTIEMTDDFKTSIQKIQP